MVCLFHASEYRFNHQNTWRSRPKQLRIVDVVECGKTGNIIMTLKYHFPPAKKKKKKKEKKRTGVVNSEV